MKILSTPIYLIFKYYCIQQKVRWCAKQNRKMIYLQSHQTHSTYRIAKSKTPNSLQTPAETCRSNKLTKYYKKYVISKKVKKIDTVLRTSDTDFIRFRKKFEVLSTRHPHNIVPWNIVFFAVYETVYETIFASLKNLFEKVKKSIHGIYARNITYIRIYKRDTYTFRVNTKSRTIPLFLMQTRKQVTKVFWQAQTNYKMFLPIFVSMALYDIHMPYIHLQYSSKPYNTKNEFTKPYCAEKFKNSFLDQNFGFSNLFLYNRTL